MAHGTACDINKARRFKAKALDAETLRLRAVTCWSGNVQTKTDPTNVCMSTDFIIISYVIRNDVKHLNVNCLLFSGESL